MKAKPTIELRQLERLRNDWFDQAIALSRRPTKTAIEKRLVEMHARVMESCGNDLDDLIKGKDHPSGRRG